MKKIMFILLIMGSIQGIYAQKTEKSKKFMVDKTLFEELTDVKKKSDKFNLYLNMQGASTRTSGTDLKKVLSKCASSVSR